MKMENKKVFYGPSKILKNMYVLLYVICKYINGPSIYA